ncbi:MAG: DUF5320 family protein [Candidatus Dojkabacteria bacterium]|nr:DUF5320 family protein [Candidatus Dojkabacteria bacterium]
MPNRDGTGPMGKGPLTGWKAGRRQGGTGECVCPKCGYKEPHTRAIPCTNKLCPKCNTPLKGKFCL